MKLLDHTLARITLSNFQSLVEYSTQVLQGCPCASQINPIISRTLDVVSLTSLFAHRPYQ